MGARMAKVTVRRVYDRCYRCSHEIKRGDVVFRPDRVVPGTGLTPRSRVCPQCMETILQLRKRTA
jgi:hypothetical protein